MKLTDAELLPCGCLIGTAGDAFVMQPCSPLCEFYRYFVAESDRQAKPIRYVADVAEPVRPRRCPDCRHVHAGGMLAGICVGCPCERRP